MPAKTEPSREPLLLPRFPTAELLRWYDEVKRDLPWRHTTDPYAILVSEIMLQQTQIATVIPFYLRFLQRFPNPFELNAARQEEVAEYWKGLGYYRRLHNLLKAVAVLVEKGESDKAARELFPHTSAELEELPGIGPYTAAAIASICFDEAVPVVDTNVLRVMARLLCIEETIDKLSVRRRVESVLTAAIDRERPGDFNQALMELGERICLNRLTHCDSCPLASDCLAAAAGIQLQLPKKKAPKAPREFGFELEIIFHGALLAVEVRKERMLQGQWQFPMRERSEAFIEPLLRVAEAGHVFGDGEKSGERNIRKSEGRRHQPEWRLEYRYSHQLWRLYPRLRERETGDEQRQLLWQPVAELLREDGPLITAHQRVLERLLKEGWLDATSVEG